MKLHQALWIITNFIAVFAIATASEEKWPRKFPFSLRNLMNKPELCESGYTDYESCDNYVSTSLAKRYTYTQDHLILRCFAIFIFNKYFI